MTTTAGNATLPTARENLQVVPHVPDNASLTSASTTLYPTGVWRDDYSAGLGAPPLFYQPSSVACSLNGGAGDSGSQVASADGKCWLAVFTAAGADIREWGGRCNNVAVDDTAFTRSFTNATGPVTILLPYGASCIVSGTVGFSTTKSGVYIKGAGRGNSTIKFPAGTTVGASPVQIFQWSTGANGGVSDVTFDVNNATSGSATSLAFYTSILKCALCVDWTVKDSAIINSKAGFAMVAIDGGIRYRVTGNYFQQTPSHNSGQAIWVGYPSGNPSGGEISRNVLVGSGVYADGANARLIGNDVSGWGFGAGLGVGVSLANLANNKNNVVASNLLHDAMNDGSPDIDNAWQHGIENWSKSATISGNTIWNNTGWGIGTGAVNGMIAGNVAFNNGLGGVNTGGFSTSIFASPATSPDGTVFENNIAYDNGTGTQHFGYVDNNPSGAGKVTFKNNTFSGPSGAYSIGAGNAQNYIYDSPQELFVSGTAVGNGADTTQDTLLSYNVPANTLTKAGSYLDIIAGGTCAASTDTKTVFVKVNGSVLAAPVCAAAGQITWGVHAQVIKTGASTQTYFSQGTVLNSANAGTASGTLALTDTSAITVLVTGQNSTNSVANSIIASGLIVRWVQQPGS